ncbi:MAG: TonB family protein, partial [Gemmatimonadota bacterium]|nr:TonB family protein [Gemmatimonadota bacterium]
PSAALLLALAALAGAQACGVDNPIVDPEATETSAPTPDASVVTAKDVSSGPTFTPFTVAPSVLNRDEVVAALNAEYPPLLRDAGVGGRVRVWFLIDENGMVQNRRIDTTSGHQALDDAALRVARAYRFSPAKDSEGVPVPVWVSFGITFQLR